MSTHHDHAAITRCRSSVRRAFTLGEMVVAMTVMTILIAGMGSAIMIATNALPEASSPLENARAGRTIAEQITGDLLCATAVTTRDPNTITFTVADRSHGDPGPETITYAWSGTAGDPLTRQYNSGTIVDLAKDVYEFDLTYTVRTLSELTTQESKAESDEMLLAFSDGWTGITATQQLHILGPDCVASEYFEIAPPDGVTEMKFTQARVMLAHAGTPPTTGVQVGIRRSKADGSYEPAEAAIGTPAIVPGGSLTTSAFWTNAFFSDVVVSDISRHDYCLVVKIPGPPYPMPSYPAYVGQSYSKSAPDDGMYHRWTDDAGSSWDPRASQLNQRDLSFYLYGSFTTKSSQQIETHRYFVDSVGIALRIGADAGSRATTTVQVLNTPEVAAP